MQNKVKLSAITKEQIKLMHFASQHTKMPLTEEEILEVAVQAHYTQFKKEFPDLFPENRDPVHPNYWV